MAEVKSIVLSPEGLMKRVQSGDSQTVAGTIVNESGNLVINPASNVEIAADKDLVLAVGDGAVDFSSSSGAFTTTTGAVTISGSSVAIDSTGANDTLTIGGSSENVSIGAVGKMVTFLGDVQIDGIQTVVGDTTFQQSATFEGDTTFGNDSAPDSVTFSANTTIDFGANVATNLADPSSAQDASTKAYADGHLGGVAYTFPAADGSAGQALATDGAGVLSWSDVTSDPAGNDTEIQFNSSGAFGASANLTFTDSDPTLVVGVTSGAYMKLTTLGTYSGRALESDTSFDFVANGSDTAIGFRPDGVDTVLIGQILGAGYLQTQSGVRLETQGELWIKEAALPSGEASYGKLAINSADSALYFVDSAGQAHYTMPDGLSDLGSISGSTALDFDPEIPSYRTGAVAGALTFTTTNLAAGRGMSVRLDNSASGSARNLTFPAGWTWLAGSAPAEIEANKVGIISLVSYGSADADVVAAWSYSDSVGITGSGASGQVAYFDGTRTITSESGLAWDETNDRLNIGAADNSTHSANLRVGGTVHVDGAVWLDGDVDLGDASTDAITVNGAMALASGASFDGVLGTVTIPEQFSIGTGNATSANVTAANLNTLTGGSDASSLHTHGSVGNVVVALNTAANSLAAGDVVCADPAAASQAKKADADASQATARVLGVVESAGKVTMAGLATSKFASGLSPAPAIGEPVYLSQTAGVLTNVAPTVGAISEVGIVVDASAYAGSGTCLVALQIKAPIFLS